MGTPYTTTTITGYNSSPPADDGSSTDANKVKWATIKTKLPDPLKTAIESINTNLVEAFDTSVVSVTGATKSVGASDNGKLLAFDTTSNAITANIAAAATLGNGWTCTFLLVDATNAVTIDPNGSETINGSATKQLTAQYQAAFLRSDGTNIHAVLLGTAALRDAATADTADTVVLRDSDGRFSQLFGATAYRTTALSIPNNTYTDLTLTAEAFDSGSIFTASSALFVAPSWATKMRMTGAVRFAINGTGSRGASVVDSSGTTTSPAYTVLTPSGGTTETSLQIATGILPITGGTSYKVQVFQNSGGALNVQGSNEETYISVEFFP